MREEEYQMAILVCALVLSETVFCHLQSLETWQICDGLAKSLVETLDLWTLLM